MSNRGTTNKYVLPDNPKWIEFGKSDGDQSKWPTNNTKVVDSEGHVNYMRIDELDGNVSLKWRIEVAKRVAVLMNMPEGPDYVLKDWPAGYQMFDHNKGPEASPRHDAYLMGSINVGKFRSPPEFIPHARWLLENPTLDRSQCECKYCSGTGSQRVITTSLNLLPKRSMSGISATPPPRRPTGPSRLARNREGREKEQHKPYAAVRRAPKPFRQQAAPRQTMSRDRNSDLRAVYGKTGMAMRRWFREGELLWCALSVPIRGTDNDECIEFWPGLVEEVKLKTEPIPRDPSEIKNPDDDTGEPSSPSEPPKNWRVSEHPSSANKSRRGSESPSHWTIRQSTEYKMKLLGVSHTYTLADDQVLPYQAYAPGDQLLEVIGAVPYEQMDTSPEKMAAFNPCPAPPTDPEEMNTFVSNDSGQRWIDAVAPYSTAVQIASRLAGTWTMTDEWDFKQVANDGSPNVTAPVPRPVPSLHDVLMSSAANSTGLYGTPTKPAPNFSSFPIPTYVGPSVTQKRFQGMWWGAERIWTDDLVRLKLARSQIAPKGAENIYPPAGPSKKTVEYNREHGFPDPEGPQFDASGRGVFMRLEALFLADVPREDGYGTVEELRASGMLYELADEDWEDPEAEKHQQKAGVKRKSPEEAGPSSADGQAGPSFMSGPSPLVQPPLPNPDPTIPIDETSASITGSKATNGTAGSHSPNVQLSHPVNSERYPMPVPPDGFKFRPILPPGHESVMSLPLISGRYYPTLLSHPLLQATIKRALTDADTSRPSDSEHLWALEGLSPGFFNAVDPTVYKKDRLQMMKDADRDATLELEVHWRERASERQVKLEMEAEPEQLMDVDP